MQLINCSVERLASTGVLGPCDNYEDNVYNFLGSIAGTCYNKGNDTPESNLKRLFNRIMSQGHFSVLEHINITYKIICDRATTHALVRHRHCAFTQESTIYSKYKDGLLFINRPLTDPCFKGAACKPFAKDELATLKFAEDTYLKQVNEAGISAGLARDVLPNSTATTLVMTTNLREWLYLISLRMNSKADSVRMHVVTKLLHDDLHSLLPRLVEAYDEKQMER